MPDIIFGGTKLSRGQLASIVQVVNDEEKWNAIMHVIESKLRHIEHVLACDDKICESTKQIARLQGQHLELENLRNWKEDANNLINRLD